MAPSATLCTVSKLAEEACTMTNKERHNKREIDDLLEHSVSLVGPFISIKIHKTILLLRKNTYYNHSFNSPDDEAGVGCGVQDS